jgi:hypothetical protein
VNTFSAFRIELQAKTAYTFPHRMQAIVESIDRQAQVAGLDYLANRRSALLSQCRLPAPISQQKPYRCEKVPRQRPLPLTPAPASCKKR